MNDEQRLRYSRHILLPELAEQGQSILLDSTALMVGLGGLGSSAALYLAAAGVGKLVLIDDDFVELGNLQRQVIHDTHRIGQAKVVSAKRYLQRLNPEVEYQTIDRRLSEEELSDWVQHADIVLDCSDNFPTRFAINRCCVTHRVPLVSASAIRMQAQISVFTHQSGCYRCLYENETETVDTCSERGVLGPLLGVMGSMQALEAVKVLTDTGQALRGRMLVFDAEKSQWREIQYRRDVHCATCGRQE